MTTRSYFNIHRLGFVLAAGLVIITALALASCRGGDKGSQSAANRDTLNINLGNEPPTLDWSLATDTSSYTVLNNIMEGLTQFDAGFRPIPALAESWTVSEDGKTYTFRIRGDVKWTDGKRGFGVRKVVKH